MPDTTFDLLNQLHKDQHDHSKHSQANLMQLKTITKDCLEKHNGLVSRLWDIDIQIETLVDASQQNALKMRAAVLRNSLKAVNSEIKISKLLDSIKSLQMELEGSSKIGEGPHQLIR